MKLLKCHVSKPLVTKKQEFNNNKKVPAPRWKW